MNEAVKKQVEALISKPEQLLRKKPFFRGSGTYAVNEPIVGDRDVNELMDARLPKTKMTPISQEQFLKELDPDCHKVLFDQNVPSICTKLEDGSYVEVEFNKMALPYQKNIKDKQVLHLCGNPMQFTLLNQTPTKKDLSNFSTIKQYWIERNQDGMRTKMVDAQKSMGDAGLLYYFDNKGQIKSRLLCYRDGYVILPVNDQNGDRILECVYYADENGEEHLDCYDDTYFYQFVLGEVVVDGNTTYGWTMPNGKKAHGFEEIPLITHRGAVAWNDVQTVIEIYEIIYNIFMVIQKRHGWGILYISGKFKETAKKIAGSVILQDTSLDGKGKAEFKTAPSPQGMIETMELLEQSIMKGSGTTFILPKDIKTGGDISGVTVQLVQASDIETALAGCIEWKNVASKMCRLFKYGLAKELVSNGQNKTAITDFQKLSISADFKVWKPRSDIEYNNMLIALKNGGILSAKTGIEKNTESTPDEEMRVAEDEAKAQALMGAQSANNGNNNNNSLN